jgi:non-specific serine/threonine protein kinase/serine/threonine-protein kinase
VAEAPPIDPTEAEAGGSGGAGLGDEALRSAFGFDADDETWLRRVRQATAEPGAAPERLGPYRLLDVTARGAQGTVFKAVQPGTNRPIAIKRLIAGVFAAPGARARFEREISAMSSLAHPGIVTVLGADVVDGQPLLLMEWVEGEPIDRWGDGVGGAGRPLRERLEVFAQVCDAVSHAHQRGVIHRDLKPSNILVERSDRGGPRARVLDFGLARLAWEDRSGASATHAEFVGTPAFAAPEQVAGHTDDIDTRTDVYSLGVVLYRLLTGRLPFESGRDVGELFRAVREDDPAPPSRWNGGVGGELDAIALKALAKEKERRYQSADALLADVRRYLAGETVLAHPPRFAYQLRKMVGRHRLPVAVGAVGAVLVLGAGMVAGVLSLRLAERGRQLSAALGQARDAEQQATHRAEEARRAQQAAEEEAARSRASAEFLREMLATLGQEVSMGQARAPREMLRQARARMESAEFRAQPATEAVLWRTLAYTSLQCNDLLLAEECLARAQEAGEGLFGPDDAETGLLLLTEGLAAERRRDPATAEGLYARAVGALRASLGPDHRDTLRALNNRGCVLRDLRRLDESEACHAEALARRERVMGPESREVATSLRNFAALRRTQGRLDEAAALYQRALDTAQRACSPGDPLIASIVLHVARMARIQGRPDDAERMLRGVLDDAVRLHGADSPAVFNAVDALAGAVVQQGRIEEALGLIDRAMALAGGSYPPDHQYHVSIRLSRAQALADLGRHDESLATLEEAAAIARTVRPAAASMEARVQRALAAARERRDRAAMPPPPDAAPSPLIPDNDPPPG